MNTLIGPQQKLFSRLDDIFAILGTTKTTFWPMLDSMSGNIMKPYGSTGAPAKILTSSDEGGWQTLSSEFSPYRHPGVYSYKLEPTHNHSLNGTHHADFTFTDGGTDDPFSLGIWAQPFLVSSNALIAKYNDTGGTQDREWAFRINGSSKLEFELYDETNDGAEKGASDTSIAVGTFQFYVVTYDGVQADPGVTFYLAGVADGTGTTDTGYTKMVTGATPVMVGASRLVADAQQKFQGRIGMTFICGKELTAANVAELYRIMRALIGV